MPFGTLFLFKDKGVCGMKKWLGLLMSVAVIVTVLQVGGSTSQATIANGEAELILGDLSYGGINGDGTQLSSPYGISVDALGNVHVSDSWSGLVKKYTASGSYIRSFFGTRGSGNGQINQTGATAIASNGDMYVVDIGGSNTIQKFSATGQYLSTITGIGYPGDISVDASDNLYVADSISGNVKKYSPTGTLLQTIGTQGNAAGQMNWPTDVVVDASGSIYVAEMNTNRIQKFTSAGALDTSFGSGGAAGSGQLSHPHGLGIDSNGNIYVADCDNHRVLKFNSAGSLVAQVGSYGTGDGQFSTPYAVTVSADNNVYVTENGNTRVTVLDTNLAFVRKWGSSGTGQGQFANPGDSATDRAGTIYVTDRDKNRVQYFSSTGQYLGVLTSGVGSWNGPASLAIDQSGKIYVLESSARRVQIFDSNRQFILSFNITGSMITPQYIAVDANGNSYVTAQQMFGPNTVKKYDATGTLVTSWGSSGNGNGQFYSVTGIAVDPAGNVLVADASSNRVQKFSPSGTYMSQFGSSGSGNGQMNFIRDIATDASGNIYVADINNTRVSVFDSNFTFVRSFGSNGFGIGQFKSLEGLSISPNSDLVVTDSGARRVMRFNLLAAPPSPSSTPTPVRVASVDLNETVLTINKSRSWFVIADVKPIHASNSNVDWVSSDEKVAIVDTKGVITAVGYGKAIISAVTVDGNHKASVEVTVPEPPKPQVTPTPTPTPTPAPTTAPTSKLTLNKIVAGQTKLTGITNSNSVVEVKINTTQYRTTAQSNGKFSLNVPKLTKGQSVRITEIQTNGTRSATKTIEIK